MSLAAALVLGVAASILIRPHSDRPLSIAAFISVLAWSPTVAAGALGIAVGIWALRRIRRRRRESRRADADVLLLADLVGLGLTAGLDFRAAVLAAAPELHPFLGDEVRSTLRRARLCGLEAALSGSSGRARQFFRLAARSTATGAPLVPAVNAYADQVRRTRRAEHLAEVRRLPVRLLLPLALLILPGFVVLTLGPALLSGLSRLEFALPAVVGRTPIP